MPELNPCGWLQNSGDTNTAQLMRQQVGSFAAAFSSSMTPRGGVNPSYGGGMVVTSGGGMSVNVASGVAHIPGSDDVSQGTYICVNTSTVNLTLSAADGSNARIDLIVAQVLDSFYTAGPDDEWELAVVAGTPAGSPSAPSLPDTALALAEVLVPASASTPSTITDVRPLLTATGGIMPIRDDTERPTVGLYAGAPVYRQDTGAVELYNGTSWLAAASVSGYQYRETVAFTSSDTFDKADYEGLRAIRVRVQAPGGGGGAATNNRALAGGGGGGGYSEKWILESALSSSETVTIGAVGAGGTGTGAGGTGGTTSFGAHASATGGVGGNGLSGTTTGFGQAFGGAGGTGSGGDINISGQAGTPGWKDVTVPLNPGNGGNSVMGHGAVQQQTSTSGGAGTSYGGGGSGGAANGGTERVGGAGGAGIILVEVYV